MTYQEFLNNILPQLNNTRSFAGKIRVADQNLTKIGSGSGRAVYDIDGEKVLKLAKNPKGVAQNDAERNVGYYRDTHHIVTKVFDEAEDSSFIISEKAKKVTERRIKELTGIPSLYEMYTYIYNNVEENNGRRNNFRNNQNKEFFDNNEFTVDLLDLAMSYSQNVGDWSRISSYGEVLRDGQPTIVLTDYGLNDEVYDTYYSPNRKQNYRVYEAYDINSEHDDVRLGMWALVPYSVGDGDATVNEEFVNFVNNRSSYPNADVKSLPYLADSFNDVINNISEVLENVDNKKKFYHNLLELQNYLIRGKFYDREPLLEDEVPMADAHSIEKEYADKIANEFAAKLGLGAIEHLGGGGNGQAYLMNGNKVLKITTDACEVYAGAKIQRAKPKTLVYVYKIYKVIDEEQNKALYVLIEDYIANKPQELFVKYTNEIIKIDNELYTDLLHTLVRGKGMKRFAGQPLENFPEMAKSILTENPDANVNQTDREQAYNFMLGLFEIKKDLMALAIKSDDYMTLSNLGYKNNVLTYFDIGGCLVNEPEIHDVVRLPEGAEEIDESVNRDTADKIANYVAQQYNFNTPKHLGAGVFGVAYDIGGNMVMKVTSDRSEAMESLNVKGKKLKYIADIYQVFAITPKSGETKHYVIILEKLRTDPGYFNARKERLVYVARKILGIEFGDIIDYYFLGDSYVRFDEKKFEKYLNKNPEDKKYFEGLKNIAEECRQYGIESTDYTNPDNLGFKRDGNIGFFDIGFGNYFAKSQEQPIQVPMEVDEDGSALYSTNSAVSRDDLPVYDQNDTSPLTDNNIPVNTSISEDLNYQHIDGDATTDQYELEEGTKSFMNGSKGVEVKEKCRLGGLGNTSAACNQGDISNLELKTVNETIDASEAYTEEGAIKAMLEGRKDVGLFAFKTNPIAKQIAIDNGWGMIKVNQTNHNLDRHIVYRQTPRGKVNAEKLYDFMMTKGGYVNDESPDEARFIGKILDYSETSIESFVRKKYPQTNVPIAATADDYNDLNENTNICKPIKITPEMEEYVKKFESDEQLLRSGGIPTDILDNAAYGFNENTLKQLPPKRLLIKWKDDFDNVLYEIQKSGKSAYQWAKSVNISEPIDVSFDGKKFYIEDGHHRFYAAKLLNLPLNVNLEIKANPILKLANGLGYDEFHRCVWKQVHNSEKTSNLNETEIMTLQQLPFKKEIEGLGGKIFSVGGAVRDEFLGKESKDLDVLITGIPMDQLEQILSKYGRVDAVGKSFGILKFKPKGSTEDIDIAIPRTEKPSGEGGHKGFEVSSDHALPIEKDLERRDFTINAIAKDAEGNIVDPYGGQKDLQNKTIRVVNPEAFADDPLRMLRAVQFASRFGFNIEPNTMKMIQENAARIREIPAERILTEFDKIVKKGNIRYGAQLLKDTGLFNQIFGFDLKQSVIDRSPFEEVKTMGEFIFLLTRLMQNPSSFYKDTLKGDIDTYKEIRALQMGFESSEATNLIEARAIASNIYLISPKTLQSQILPEIIEKAAKELLMGQYPKSISELAVNGNDLMAMGLQGKQIGDTLKSLLLNVYSGKLRNNREELLKSLGLKQKMINEEVDASRIEYGCLMLYMEVPVWSKIVSIIDKKDEYDKPGYGIETEPHVTILYGFHNEVTADEIFDTYRETEELKPIEIGLTGISIFETPECDVVKFDVESEVLHKLHEAMGKLPHTSTHPNYHPHLTIAYVKKGEGKKYVKKFEKPRKLVGNELVYTWKGHKGREGGETMSLDK